MNEQIVDSLADEADGSRSVWKFCGAFPLLQISEGIRACRGHWRDRRRGPPGKEHECAMLAVAISIGENEITLILEREYEDEVDGTETFANVEDMLATDWYLEAGTIKDQKN